MSLAAPNTLAISTSRARPVIRDSRVRPLMATAARSRFTGWRFKEAERQQPLCGLV